MVTKFYASRFSLEITWMWLRGKVLMEKENSFSCTDVII